MKLIIKFFTAILVLGVGGLFILKKPDGSPWLDLSSFIPSLSLKDAKQSVTQVIPDQIISGRSDEQVTVYKWKDAEGNWQFSDTPPPQVAAQQVQVGTNVNRDLVPQMETSSSPAATPKSGKAILIPNSGSSGSTTPLPTPDNVAKLIEDAKNVQNIMDQRQQQLDSQLKN